MAVEEIRALSKRMNSHIVAAVGLEESITDITFNMQKINNISAVTYIERDLVSKLSEAQQLMVFRIVQEQTNNILKHADASETTISLKESEGICHLEIIDNGKGFEGDLKGRNGLGFINIFNRVDAYNGKIEIISSPGNGCRLDIIFPLS
jgi:signal transduction histidine kinase